MMTAIILVAVVAAVLGLSLYLSRGNWPYHAEGAKGYVRDTLIYAFLPAFPAFVCVMGYNLLILARPELQNDTLNYGLLVVALVGLFVTRRLPFVSAAHKRVTEARHKRYQSMSPR